MPKLPAEFADLEGCAADDHDAALDAFRKSCDAFSRQPPSRRKWIATMRR